MGLCATRVPVSVQNMTANHRVCDVIVCEGKDQVLTGRFMYGPLDMVTLTGEKVPLGSWVLPWERAWGQCYPQQGKGCGDQDPL